MRQYHWFILRDALLAVAGIVLLAGFFFAGYLAAGAWGIAGVILSSGCVYFALRSEKEGCRCRE
jgi:hypothetical protein